MRKKPSLDEFRSGSSEEAEPAVVAPSTATKPARPPLASSSSGNNFVRINKTFRLRQSFESKLKEHAFLSTQREGRRITESDIIDSALEAYFAKK